jgi:HEAT repeat protein
MIRPSTLTGFVTLLLLVPRGLAGEPRQQARSENEPANGATAGEAEATAVARDALAKFERHCPPPTGGASNTRTWKVRMECLVTVVKAGPPAVPVLVGALKSGPAWTRAFAAQALGILAEPDTRPALLGALEHKDGAVRLHAIRALGRMGRLRPTPALRAIAEKDASSTVGLEMTFALARDEGPDPAAVRKLVAGYDLKRLGTASVGKAAPEFALPDTSGKIQALKDFRGKQSVVLVFLQHSN